MNTPLDSPKEVERALGQQIQKLLREIPWIHGVHASDNPAPFQRAFDWLVVFSVPNGPTVELWIDCRADPRPAHFPYVGVERDFEQGQTKRVRLRVFGAPNLSPRMREICQRQGWGWFDLAGNCRINVPGILYLERTGIEPIHRQPKAGANLGTREAARVMRALLTPRYARQEWTQRSMQMHCEPGVSLGLVNKVVQHLRDEAFLESLPDGGFRVIDPVKLLFAWRDAYRFDQHRRMGFFTLLQGKALRERLAALDGQPKGFAAYAAFSAADFQAPHVRQARTWLYVTREMMERFVKTIEASPVDTGENLVVLEPADDGVFFQTDGRNTDEPLLPRTNVVQTYVDLWHCGGRGREAAAAVLEQRLKPVWEGKELPR